MIASVWERLPVWGRMVPWIALAAIFVAALFGDQGLIQLHGLRAEQRRLDVATREEEALNLTLRRQVRQLQTNTRFLEKLVREEMRYARPGEIVYQFQEP